MKMVKMLLCCLLLLAVANPAYSMGWFSNDHNSGGSPQGGVSNNNPKGDSKVVADGNSNPNPGPGPGSDPGPASTPVPEPSAVLLLATGLVGLGIAYKSRRKK